MKLSDPFNRVEKRDAMHYRSFRNSMSSAGIDSVEQAEKAIVSVQSRAKTSVTFVVLVTLALALVLQTYAALVLGVGGLIVLWLVKTAYRAKLFMRRYIDDELNNPSQSDPSDLEAKTLETSEADMPASEPIEESSKAVESTSTDKKPDNT